MGNYTHFIKPFINGIISITIYKMVIAVVSYITPITAYIAGMMSLKLCVQRGNLMKVITAW